MNLKQHHELKKIIKKERQDVIVNTRSALVFLLIAILATLTTLVKLTPVSANGPHPLPEEIYTGNVGPYSIKLEAIHTIGSFHITAFVTEFNNNKSLNNITITVTGEQLETGEKVGPVLGDFDQDKNAYLLTLNVKETGNWTFTIIVDSPLGKERLEISIPINDPGGINWATIGMAIVLLTLLSWFAGKSILKR